MECSRQGKVVLTFTLAKVALQCITIRLTVFVFEKLVRNLLGTLKEWCRVVRIAKPCGLKQRVTQSSPGLQILRIDGNRFFKKLQRFSTTFGREFIESLYTANLTLPGVKAARSALPYPSVLSV